VIVLDASAAAELLLDTPRGAVVARRIAAGDETVHVPELLGIEIASVLRRMLLRGALDEGRARRVIDELDALGVESYPHAALLHRVLDLRENLTAYDALYVALAEALDAALVTCDAKLATASGHGAQIEHVGDA